MIFFVVKLLPKCFSIVVTPRVLDSSDDVRSLLINERHCKFSDETDDSSLFQIYSHNGCLFECLWRQAQEACGCIPWKYPQLGDATQICDFVGNLCFRDIINEGARVLNCNCPVDCSKISYDYYIVKEELKPQVECSNVAQNGFLIEYLSTYQANTLNSLVQILISNYKITVDWLTFFNRAINIFNTSTHFFTEWCSNDSILDNERPC